MLTDKEVALLKQIQATPQVLSQKILSQKTGISVGLINAVMKKMICKGYVKVRAINKKKLHYLLTRRGSVQLIRKLYHSILNTIRHYQKLESKITITLNHIVQMTGKNKFLIARNGELSEIVARVVRNQLSPEIHIITSPTGHDNYFTLNLTDKTLGKNPNTINLLHLLHSDDFSNNQRQT